VTSALGTFHLKAKLINRRWRAPELLFSPTTYDPFALDLWGIGVVITDMFRPIPKSDSDSEDEDEDEDVDPLEGEVIRPQVRTTLFDDDFGDIGLAGSIFRVLGTPTQETWLVSLFLS
jgi:serine/threonine protein kinase